MSEGKTLFFSQFLCISSSSVSSFGDPAALPLGPSCSVLLAYLYKHNYNSHQPLQMANQTRNWSISGPLGVVVLLFPHSI